MDEDVQHLPIDIHVGKLVEWLVSRQHSSKDWAETARLVREKINAAIQDMPEHPEITKLLSGTYINYFHCLKIVEILRETEADSKNILGWYTSQRMKDWQAVLKLYEKGGVGLAESGQLLHRYISYELPGIKSQVARCTQIQQECDKRDSDIHKTATHHRNAYNKQCKQMGITGEHVRSELIGLLSELPEELNAIGKRCSDLKEAANYYLDFVGFTSDGRFQDSLPLLRYIIEHGNVTTYEYHHGEAPLSVEDPTSSLLAENTAAGADGEAKEGDGGGIDFGDDAGGIDFGDDGAGDGIDFGDDGDGGIDFGDSEQIDWNAADLSAAEITVEESGVEGGVARNTEALTILQNPTTRDKILDDISELEGFLRQRMVEMNNTEDSRVVLNLWDDAPKSLQMVSPKTVSGQLIAVQEVLQNLSTAKMTQLFLISASHRYVDRLTQRLEEQERRCNVPSGSLEAVKERRQQAIQQQKALLAQSDLIKKAAKVLNGQVQETISNKYKGRPVNIMGVTQNL